MGFFPFSFPEVERLLRLTEEGLRRFMDSDLSFVLEVGNYAVGSGGKRLRPLVTLAVARAGGVSEEELRERVVPLAVGIEYIHTASLLHDDVVDDADTRRGKRSAHRVFGNAAAVLTGDYMYANALHLYSVYGTPKMIEVVSEAVKTMAEGQLLELKRLGELIGEEEYFKIVDGKTAALFGAAAGVGALASERFSDRHGDWILFGTLVGRAFQLIDDALDYGGDEKTLGKPAGQDLREGKTTYPLLSVLELLDGEKVRRALVDSKTAEELVAEVVRAGGVERTKERARAELKKALEILESFEADGEAKEFLRALVEFVVERTY